MSIRQRKTFGNRTSSRSSQEARRRNKRLQTGLPTARRRVMCAPLHYVSLPIPGDECETWTREQLETMNARFVNRLEQAFELGLESRASASSQIKLPSHSPRWSSPLCPEVWTGLLRSAAAGGIMVVARR